MKTYRTVDTTTVEGLKEAERLNDLGWAQYRVGLFSTTFVKASPRGDAGADAELRHQMDRWQRELKR